MYSGRRLEWFFEIGWYFCVMGVFVVWILIWGFSQALLTQTCLQAGYPEGRMSWTLDGYCVKRVDQTDVVVPVGQVKK